MNPTLPTIVRFAVFALCASVPIPAVAASESARPNIVLIVIDDLGYGDLGCYGNTLHKTPHLDRLANDGMRFTDFHTNGAVCSPTRAALLTGQYQQRSGIEAALGFTLDEGMPLAKTTIAELLAPAGYQCAAFGKWHVGHVTRFGPNDQGFQESRCTNNTPDYHSHVSRDGNLDWWANQKQVDEPGYLTDLVTKHTLNFIRAQREKPFFIFMSHIAVHFPFQGPKDPPQRTGGKQWNDNKYGPLPKEQYRRAYREMLEAVDASVGQVVSTLDQLGLRKNTLIFVTSDNGAYAWVGSNGVLRGQKGDLYEGGHRVAAFANWPGKIRGGVVSNATLMTMDLLPTVLALTGISKPAGLAFDGTDVSGVWLRQGTLGERTLFWRGGGAKAARRGPWKLVVTETGEELYNLSDDLSEKRNLASAQPARVTELRAALIAWERDVTPVSGASAR